MSAAPTLQGARGGGGVRGMDATPQGSLLPATLLSTCCELSCGGLGVWAPISKASGGLGGAGSWGSLHQVSPSKK